MRFGWQPTGSQAKPPGRAAAQRCLGSFGRVGLHAWAGQWTFLGDFHWGWGLELSPPLPCTRALLPNSSSIRGPIVQLSSGKGEDCGEVPPFFSLKFSGFKG